MEIRPATAKDRPHWLEVRRSLRPHLSREAHERAISELLSGTGHLLVFHQESVRMGYVEGRILPGAEGGGRIGVIESWYILPNFRQVDIGAHLLRAVETWFQGHGCTEIRSEAHMGKEASYKHHIAVASGERAPGSFVRKKLPPPKRIEAETQAVNAVELPTEPEPAERPARIDPRLETPTRLTREGEPDTD